MANQIYNSSIVANLLTGILHDLSVKGISGVQLRSYSGYARPEAGRFVLRPFGQDDANFGKVAVAKLLNESILKPDAVNGVVFKTGKTVKPHEISFVPGALNDVGIGHDKLGYNISLAESSIDQARLRSALEQKGGQAQNFVRILAKIHDKESLNNFLTISSQAHQLHSALIERGTNSPIRDVFLKAGEENLTPIIKEALDQSGLASLVGEDIANGIATTLSWIKISSSASQLPEEPYNLQRA